MNKRMLASVILFALYGAVLVGFMYMMAEAILIILSAVAHQQAEIYSNFPQP